MPLKIRRDPNRKYYTRLSSGLYKNERGKIFFSFSKSMKKLGVTRKQMNQLMDSLNIAPERVNSKKGDRFVMLLSEDEILKLKREAILKNIGVRI